MRTDLGRDSKNSDVNPTQRWIEGGSWSGGNFEQDSNMSRVTHPEKVYSVS